MIRVLIADDHAIVRSGLTELVNSADDLVLVGQAGDGNEAVALAAELIPDVVLMDLAMPELDGISATRAILDDNPGIQIVALTSFSDRERILAALEAGAIGYLLKDATPDELLAGIRSAARGDSPLAPKAARTESAARPNPGSTVLRGRCISPGPPGRSPVRVGHASPSEPGRFDQARATGDYERPFENRAAGFTADFERHTRR